MGPRCSQASLRRCEKVRSCAVCVGLRITRRVPATQSSRTVLPRVHSVWPLMWHGPPAQSRAWITVSRAPSQCKPPAFDDWTRLPVSGTGITPCIVQSIGGLDVSPTAMASDSSHLRFRAGLACLSDVCVVMIESCAPHTSERYIAHVRNGLLAHYGPCREASFQSHGTRVTLYQLFSNLPVRRRALSRAKELRLCVEFMQGIGACVRGIHLRRVLVVTDVDVAALVYPRISVSLVDTDTSTSLVDAHSAPVHAQRVADVLGVGVAALRVFRTGSVLAFATPEARPAVKYMFVNRRFALLRCMAARAAALTTPHAQALRPPRPGRTRPLSLRECDGPCACATSPTVVCPIAFPCAIRCCLAPQLDQRSLRRHIRGLASSACRNHVCSNDLHTK